MLGPNTTADLRSLVGLTRLQPPGTCLELTLAHLPLPTRKYRFSSQQAKVFTSIDVLEENMQMMLLCYFTLFVAAVTAQFQFFDQFFSGQQQQGGQQEKQNVASDSAWFQQNWHQGKLSGAYLPAQL